MSPKKTIFVATGIFAGIGISVSIIIIAINGGFSGTVGGPSIFNPPTSKDLWTLGSNIADGMNLTYSLTSNTGENKPNLIDSIVSMRFHNMGEKWNVDFKIQNGSNNINNNGSEIHVNYSKNQLLRTDRITEQDNKFIQPIEASVLAIRDIAREPKYLVVGAVWDKRFTGSNTIDAKIQSKDTISTPAGTFDVYSLQYKIGNSLSTIYINRDLSLPIKAQVYGDNDKLLYEYQLQSIAR